MTSFNIGWALFAVLGSTFLHAAAPENDDFAEAELLALDAGEQVFFHNNIDATSEVGESAATGLFGPNRSVWFKIKRPPFGASFTVTTNGSNFDTILSVFRGSQFEGFAELEEVVGDNDGGAGVQSQVSFAVLDASQKDYFISVDGNFGAQGSIQLHVVAAPPVVQDACSTSGSFPATCPAPSEEFGGGADAFDLDQRSITFVPHEVMVNGQPETHYRYSVHRIRRLPVDLTQVEPLPFPPGPVPTNGFPFFGETTSSLSASDASVFFSDSLDSEMDFSFDVLRSEVDFFYLNKEFRLLSEPERITIQFDFYVGSDVDLGFVETDGLQITCQVEFHQNGMIRASYFGVDAEKGRVGLSDGATFPPEDDLSASRLKVSDVVVNESEASADFTIELPAVQGAAFDFEVGTSDGSALQGLDYQSVSGTDGIPGGVGSSVVSIPLVVDAIPETEEFFGMRITVPGYPDWILADASGWILDSAPPGGSSAAIVEILGNRVFFRQSPNAPSLVGAYRIVAIDGGALRDPDTGLVVPLNGTITPEMGLAGLMVSGPGVSFVVESVADLGGEVVGRVAFDVDGSADGTVFQFTREVIEVVEGASAEVVVEASQEGGSVEYEILPGTAVAADGGGGDYLPSIGTLEFEDGVASVFIPVLSDQLTEGVEEFQVRLHSPSDGGFLGPVSVIRVLVSDGVGANRTSAEQRMPDSMVSGRNVRVRFKSADFPGHNLDQSWRFQGEPFWRPSGGNAWNVMEGFQLVESLPSNEVDPFFLAPGHYADQGAFSGLSGVDVVFEGQGSSDSSRLPPSPVPLAGSLQVDFSAGAPVGGMWRRLGQVNWRDAGAGGAETGLPPGKYLIEFKDDLAGFLAPGLRTVRIHSEERSFVEATYLVRPPTAATPQLVATESFGSSGAWSARPVNPLSDSLEVSFELQPGVSTSESYVGLSAGAVTDLNQLEAIVRVGSGEFSASDGGSYVSLTTLAPTEGEWFFVEFIGNVADRSYDLFITSPAGIRMKIADDAEFQGSPAELDHLSMISVTGSHAIRNIRSRGFREIGDGWMAYDIPDQEEPFELGFLLDMASSGSFLPPHAIQIGFSESFTTSPTLLLDTLEVTLPDEEIIEVPIRVEADPGSGSTSQFSYTVEVIDGTESVSGELASGLAKVGYVYIRYLDDFGDPSNLPFAVLQTAFPPHVVAPSGPAPANDPEDWMAIPIEPQTGRFSISFDVRTLGETVGASSDLIDGVVALSENRICETPETCNPNNWKEASVVLRARNLSAGPDVWDAHTGGAASGTFTRDNDLTVVDGDLYHVEFEVDVLAQSYRATVRPDGGSPVVVMENGSFRKAADELRFIILRNVQGRLEVSDIRGPLAAASDAPLAFTGRIETSRGFGSGVVVGDYSVLTSARLVFDSGSFSFVPEVIWSLPAVRRPVVPDANQPSSILLSSGYAAALLASSSGGDAADDADVAVLAFRPLNLPKHRNAPGRGGFSGFMIDDGSASWATASERSLVSFPVSGIPVEDRGWRHQTDLSASSFGAVVGFLHEVGSDLETPPGSEGAPVFVQAADGRFRPAAICLGSSSGTPRFRAIDRRVADVIHQANQFQRQPDYLQELIKGGVYYIPTTLEGSVDPNRGHVFYEAIPSGFTWMLSRNGYGDPLTVAGGQGLSVEPGTYTAVFPDPPNGFSYNPGVPLIETFDGRMILSKLMLAESEWHLPEVYLSIEATDYDSWLEQNFSEAEQAVPEVSGPNEASPWLGVDNLLAYAFGLDPKGTSVHPADLESMTPGLPIVRRDGEAVWIEFLRRMDPELEYKIEYGSSLEAPWSELTTPPELVSTSAPWERVRWDITDFPGATERVFARVRVELNGE